MSKVLHLQRILGDIGDMDAMQIYVRFPSGSESPCAKSFSIVDGKFYLCKKHSLEPATAHDIDFYINSEAAKIESGEEYDMSYDDLQDMSLIVCSSENMCSGTIYGVRDIICSAGRITLVATEISVNVTLTTSELLLVRDALNCHGDLVANVVGRSAGERYWDLMNKFTY